MSHQALASIIVPGRGTIHVIISARIVRTVCRDQGMGRAIITGVRGDIANTSYQQGRSADRPFLYLCASGVVHRVGVDCACEDFDDVVVVVRCVAMLVREVVCSGIEELDDCAG